MAYDPKQGRPERGFLRGSYNRYVAEQAAAPNTAGGAAKAAGLRPLFPTPTSADGKAYLVSRDLWKKVGKFPRDLTPDHQFLAVPDPRTGKPMVACSFGPSADWPGGKLVDLTAPNSPTAANDRDALNNRASWETHLTPIQASPEAVLAACRAMAAQLGNLQKPGGTPYSPVPDITGGANSNSAAIKVANDAIQAEHPGAPALMPPKGSFKPGSDNMIEDLLERQRKPPLFPLPTLGPSIWF